MNTPVDKIAATHGLPESLRIPIAAASLDAIKQFVGSIDEKEGVVMGRNGRVNAVCVQSFMGHGKDPSVGLWRHKDATLYAERLYPTRQIWVHVDFRDYRGSYLGFGLPIPPGYFLDHVQNRKAMQALNRSHPYLRLCPVAPAVNSSGGSQYGAEGREKDYINNEDEMIAPKFRFNSTKAPKGQIIYADPVDITKMIDKEPGLYELEGVREIMPLLYP